ncbi:SDR family NAD(P)-dependent oxidoreductase [Roseivirga sp. BDSF3-8]|uniref:SDR family NAD(P)-dependent oxidoreductase n=1 Tax=Roseivirga sp. BDSF3-8 TaxID=3241598 RepID=UPI003531FAF1
MKNVLITGAAGNLGRAVVARFLKEGWQVTALAEPGNSAAEHQEDTSHLNELEADLMSEDGARKAVEKATASTAPDAAVMLVGGFAMGNIADTDEKSLMDMYKLNFLTAYHTARPVFEKMKEGGKGGRLVFIGARPALDASAGKDVLPYALSKNLVIHLAEYLNEAGKEHGIVASVVVPSIIDTPPNREGMPDADFSQWVKPEDIAQVISFACGEQGDVLREPVYKVYGNA